MTQNTMQDITGVVVCQNTHSLLKRAYESVRKYHPEMPIIIIDGSDRNDPCYAYSESLRSAITTVVLCNYNIGHGKGMDMAIKMCRTRFALIFDSDIEMLKNPVDQMLAMMEEDTYGVGYTEMTGEDGFEYGAHPHHRNEKPTRYLHPYFMLLQVSQYAKFPPFCHHGAPCVHTMTAIKRAGLSDKILKGFPGLGHTASAGWNWKGEAREWIRHDTRGTRDVRTKKHLPEIEGGWDYGTNRNPRPGLFTKRV